LRGAVGDRQAGTHGEALRQGEDAEEVGVRHDVVVSAQQFDKISTQEKTGVKLETGGTCQCQSLRAVNCYLVIVYLSVYLAQFLIIIDTCTIGRFIVYICITLHCHD